MNSLYTRAVSGLVFPLHERLKHHDTVVVRKQLEQTQWWSPDRLAQLQLQRLRSLLQHAQQHVPYYRELFARTGFEPAAVTSLADLQRLGLGEVDLLALKSAGLVAQIVKTVKVIKSGELTNKVVLKGVIATAGAKVAIEAAGGSIA